MADALHRKNMKVVAAMLGVETEQLGQVRELPKMDLEHRKLVN